MSSIKMTSSEVKKRAEYVLKDIHKQREKLLENAIDAMIAKSEKCWVRRLFRQPVLTREGALELLTWSDPEYLCPSEYDVIQLTYKQHEERVEDLLKMVEFADEIMLSVEDFRKLM